MSKLWPATDLTGGGFGALDAIPGALLGDGDGALVITQDQSAYHYTLDATSGAAEDVPNVIIPDTDPGTKRWLLAAPPLLGVDYISFNNDPAGVPLTPGTLSFDKATRMLQIQSDIQTSKLNIGLEDWTRVRNETGVDMNDGDPVFGVGIIDSPLTGEPTWLVAPAVATAGPIGIPGILTSDIADGAEGYAATRGDVKDYDTSTFTVLQDLFVPDVPGPLTVIPPTPPNYAIPVAYVKDIGVNGRIYLFIDNPTPLVNATNAAVASGDPTGFHDNDNILVEYDPVARTITLTGNIKYSWRGQVKELTSPWVSDPHPDILDSSFFLYSINGIDFIWSTTPWEFSDIQAAFVTYNTTNKYALREVHGLMNWQAHEEFHQTVGTYKLSGGDLSNYVLNSTTPANRRPDISAATIKDEDIRTIDAALTSSLFTNAFLTGTGDLTFTLDAADIVPLNGNFPYWNEFVDPNWQQTSTSNGDYISVWVIAVPATADADSQKYRYIFLQGQSAGSYIGQNALFPQDLALGNLAGLFSEFSFIAQIIIKITGNNWQFEEVKPLTGTRASVVGSPAGNYLSSVSHDDTSSGSGTASDPLIVLSGTPRGGGAGDGIQKNSSSDFDFGILKNNLFAIIPPTVNDDALAGYGVDSRWIDQAGLSIYQCIDSTVGAAVWVDLSSSGGGGIWEDVETRPMTGKLVELFPVTDDHMKLRFDNVSTAGATDQIFPRVKLSLNNGVSYPSKWDGRGWQAFLSLGYINFTNSAQMLMLRNGINDNVNGSIEFNGLLDAGDVTMYESGGVGNNSGNGLDTNTQKGRFNEVGVITTISVQDNKPLSTGYITLLKRLF